eukprot:2361383-Amphidinium_carterae.1
MLVPTGMMPCRCGMVSSMRRSTPRSADKSRVASEDNGPNAEALVVPLWFSQGCDRCSIFPQRIPIINKSCANAGRVSTRNCTKRF